MGQTVVDMINLYILNESSPADAYGIGTYIRELTAALKDSDINICIVHLHSDKPDMETEKIEGLRYWYIPAPFSNLDDEEQKERYYHNIIHLLQLYIVEKENKENMVFHMIDIKSKPLVDTLRATFDCKIVLVVHDLDSITTLSGNISRLRRIHFKPKDPTNEVEKLARQFFHQERELFYAVDKVIFVSNHTYEMLKCVGYLY